jgi:hypothetical protein
MTIYQADQLVLCGWDDVIEELIDAMKRYRDHGPILKDSPSYDRWTARIDALQEAIDV